MRLILFLVLAFVAGCNKQKTMYAYELENNGTNFFVPLNASCVESAFSDEFKKKYCYLEDKIYRCETEDRSLFGFKEFNTKNICDSEVSALKKTQIGGVATGDVFSDKPSEDTIKNSPQVLKDALKDD